MSFWCQKTTLGSLARDRHGHLRGTRNRGRRAAAPFYLKYVAPRRTQIEKRLYQGEPIETLLAWDTVLGLQLENLVLASMQTLRSRIGLSRVTIVNAGPYIQRNNQRRRGCQVDLLIRTKRALYVIEIKQRRRIGRDVIDEVKQKVSRLAGTRGLSVRTGLVYVGQLDPGVEAEDYFDYLLPFDDLLES